MSANSRTLTVRPSHLLKHDDCPRAYYYQYVLGILPRIMSINLPFGTSVHDASTEFLKFQALGQAYDPVAAFEKDFEDRLNSTAIEIPSGRSEEDYLRMGKLLVERFPPAWEKTGLSVLIDPNGEPVIERTLRARIAPGIILSGTPDIFTINEDGDVGVPDIKTPAQVSSPIFSEASEQLTSYEILAENPTNREALGIDQIDQLGFLEGIKKLVPKSNKGEGPTWQPIHWSESRSDEAKQEVIRKAVDLKRNHERGYFPKRPRMAYNTPCDMCDFREFCHKGNPEGLMFPETTTNAQAQPVRMPQRDTA